MKVQINNGDIVTVMNGGIPLRKTFFAQKEDGTLILCTVKGELQLVFEPGVDNWSMASVARSVDSLQDPLIEPITIKANPLENEPTD